MGSGVIVFESVRRLAAGAPEVDALWVGIGVIAFSVAANVVVSSRLARKARETDSPALEGDAAHLRTDAATSAAVLVGLLLVQLTGATWLDPVIALIVAAAILYAGLRLLARASRVLVDEALPADELDAVRDAIDQFGTAGVCGYHKLRARRAGSRRYVDLHVQFVRGTTLEVAHTTAHELQDAIRERVRGADVLIHLEPSDRVRPGTEIPREVE